MTDKLDTTHLETLRPQPGTISTINPGVLTPVSVVPGIGIAVLQQCNSYLTSAQQYADQAQAANAAVQNALGVLAPLTTQLQAELGVAEAVNATQSQLDLAHATATLMQTVLTALQTSSTQATSSAASASQTGTAATGAHCYNLAAINAAVAQAQSASAAAAAGSSNIFWFALQAQGALGITRPGPQGPVSGTQPPPQTPPSFNPTASVQTALGIPVELDIKLDETDTQSLIAGLVSNDGGSFESALITAVVGVATSALAAVLSGGGVTLATFAGSVAKLLLQGQLLVLVAAMKEADNQGKGVTLHFSLPAAGVGALGALFNAAGLTAATVVARCEVNLVQEASTPGGKGDLTDLFWVTGN